MRLLELALVGTMVLVAATYSIWALLPATARRRAAHALAAATDRPGCPGWLRRAALGLRRRVHEGGSPCDDCGVHGTRDGTRR